MSDGGRAGHAGPDHARDRRGAGAPLALPARGGPGRAAPPRPGRQRGRSAAPGRADPGGQCLAHAWTWPGPARWCPAGPALWQAVAAEDEAWPCWPRWSRAWRTCAAPWPCDD
jgi:hypothetical protein